MQLLATINPQHATQEEIGSYRLREAARAIVLDNEHNVALLHVGKYNYFKLPGGGIDEGEEPAQALHRECLEEIGCEIEILNEIGKIIEHRKMYTIEQISYCYFAKVSGEKGKPNFTKKELSEGFEQIWIPYDEAVTLISKNTAIGIEGSEYIVPRDTILIEAAREFIE